MTKKEIVQIVEMTVQLTVEKVLEQKRNIMSDTDEWLTTSDAAKYLGISAFRMRELKHHFDCRKVGKAQSARLLFKKATLLENYCAINS